MPVFAQLCKEKLPGVNVFNIADDSLVKGIMRGGQPHADDRAARGELSGIRRTRGRGLYHGDVFVHRAGGGGGREIDWRAGFARGPADGGQGGGDRQKNRRGRDAADDARADGGFDFTPRAAARERQIELTSRLCEGAFEALMSGDAATHDAKVAAALKELSQQVDVIVLAQASMARVVDTLKPEDKRVPILASPGIAVDYLATVLK